MRATKVVTGFRWGRSAQPKKRGPIHRWAMIAAAFLASAAGVADAAPSPGTPIFRAQIRLTVCDQKHAGSDELTQDISVKLNADNLTVLDRGGSDFGRGSVRTYDLNLNGIASAGDITKLQIFKKGKNGVCLSDIRLRLNDKEAFSYPRGDNAAMWVMAFGGTAKIWLDDELPNKPTRTFPRSQIVSNSIWRSYSFNLLADVPQALWENEIESRLEALGATYFHTQSFGVSVRWGSGEKSVEVTRRLSRNSMRVEMDLKASVKVIKDPRIDVDFDLTFSCTDRVLRIAAENVDVNVDLKRAKRRIANRWLGRKGKPSIGEMERQIESEIGKTRIQVRVPSCPPIRVYEPRDVYVSLRAPAPLI